MSRLSEFLEVLNSKSTKDSYTWAVRGFLEAIFKHKTVDLEQAVERYFSKKRDYEKDIRTFQVALKSRPPKSQRFALSVIRNFLLENDVELKALFWKRVSRQIKGSKARTNDKVPSNADLKSILAYMPIQGRALYLVLSSSGMRIGEALALSLSELDLKSDPPRVLIRGENSKTGDNRTVFLSSEAKEALEDWLKVRDRYLKGAISKSHRWKDSEDSRVFPFTTQNAYVIWYNALEKAGFKAKDNGTGRYTIHPHVLRKFYRTRLGGVIHVDIVEALMGHEGYLTNEYRRPSEEDLAKSYKQGEHALLVFSNGGEISKVLEDVKQERTHVENFLGEFTKKIALENQELKTKLAELELKYTDVGYRLSQAELAIRSLHEDGKPIPFTTHKGKRRTRVQVSG